MFVETETIFKFKRKYCLLNVSVSLTVLFARVGRSFKEFIDLNLDFVRLRYK